MQNIDMWRLFRDSNFVVLHWNIRDSLVPLSSNINSYFLTLSYNSVTKNIKPAEYEISISELILNRKSLKAIKTKR